MKLPWIAAPVCLVIGILIGRTSERSAKETEAGPDGPLRTRRPSPTTYSESSQSSFGTLRTEILKAPSDKMPGLLKRSLVHPDAFERRELILQCLRGMDSQNWQEVFLKFAEVTQETGMKHREEWMLSLMMAGRAGNRDAAEWFRKGPGGDQLKEVVWGWSQQDPQAALKWLDDVSAETPELRGRLLSVVVGGAAQRDGLAAIKMLHETPLAERMACVGDFGWNLIQRDGLDSAVEWAIQTKANSSAGEEEYVQRVTNHVAQSICDGSKDVSGARNAAGRMARLIDADPDQNQQIRLFVTRLPGGQPFEFLSELSNKPVAKNAGTAEVIRAQLDFLARSRPDLAARWLANHPNDAMAPSLRALIQ